MLLSPGDMALRCHLIEREVVQRRRGLFLELMRWAEGGSCRHDTILRYFGDEADPEDVALVRQEGAPASPTGVLPSRSVPQLRTSGRPVLTGLIGTAMPWLAATVRLGLKRLVRTRGCLAPYLAAFALTSGCQMVTNDSAFRQFSGLDLLLLA